MSHHNPLQNDVKRQPTTEPLAPAAPSRPSAWAALARRPALSGGLAGWAVRVVAIAAIAWAVLAPAYRAPSSVSAAAQPSDASVRQATGTYTVAGGAIGNYFTARGGTRTFGPAASNAFTLLGAQVQIFRNHVLKENPDGSVSTMPLLDLGAVPGTRIGGRTLPDADPAVLNATPVPGSADYATRAQAFIRANAPDEWQGMPVGFHRAFLGTVTFQDAFPSGSGERGLLPGMAQEVWGLPVSRPMRDPATPDVVYLRWGRGVMAFDARTGQVETVPLGETFRAVLTGEGIPQDLLAAAQGSQFHAQFQPSAADGVARPDALPDSSLASAFQVSTSSGFSSAAAAGQQVGDPYYPTATPTQQFGGSYNFGTPTPTPFGYTGSFQNQNQGGFGGFGTPTPTPFGYSGGFNSGFGTPTPTPYGYTGGFQNQGSGIGGSAIQGGTGSQGGPLPVSSPGVDQCFGDEQITFAPDPPRVGNEFLIAVSSSRPHPFGRLAGTEQTQFQRERPGQVGLVWEWLVKPNYPGKHEYTFYVDSTIPCKKIEFTVEAPLATATIRPTRTPRPFGFDDNRNRNSNSNSNSNDNGSGSSSSTNGADVQVQVNNPPSQLNPNEEREYQVVVSNGSGGSADGVTFSATLSSNTFNSGFNNGFGSTGTGATFTNVSTSKGSCSTSSGTSIQCNLNRLDRNDGAMITIRVRATTPGASVTTSYTASTTSFEGNYGNNSNSSFMTVSGQGSSNFAPPTSTLASGTNNGNLAGLNCFNYVSQSAAQARLRANPSDPDLLDYSYNGIACEPADIPSGSGFYMSGPFDLNPVPRSSGGTFGTPTPTPFGYSIATPFGTPTVTPTPRPFNANDYLGQGDRYNCIDFASQSQAQAVLRADPRDPNKLDTASTQGNGIPDGVACTTRFEAPEWADGFYYPEPLDRTPVPRPGVIPTPTPSPTPMITATPTSASRATSTPVPPTSLIPGSACSRFGSQADAQRTLRNDPNDPLVLDNSRDGIACLGVDGAGFFPAGASTDMAPVQRPAPGATVPATNCDAAYPGVCIPPPPPDLDCSSIPYRNFTVRAPDPHNFDGDGDGKGCETS